MCYVVEKNSVAQRDMQSRFVHDLFEKLIGWVSMEPKNRKAARAV
jgi:hypothetical protein